MSETIKAAINVIPSRKTHEIQANSDQRQKIIISIFGAQYSKLKKKLVLRTCMMRDKLFLDLRAKS